MHCSDRTGLVVIDQVTSATARRFPIEAVGPHRPPGRSRRSWWMVRMRQACCPSRSPRSVPTSGSETCTSGRVPRPGRVCSGSRRNGADSCLRWWCRPMNPTDFPSAYDRVGTNDLSAWLAAPSALQPARARSAGTGCGAITRTSSGWAQSRVAEILDVPAEELRHDPGPQSRGRTTPARRRRHAGAGSGAPRPSGHGWAWRRNAGAGTAAARSGSPRTSTTARPTTSGWPSECASSCPADGPPQRHRPRPGHGDPAPPSDGFVNSRLRW